MRLVLDASVAIASVRPHEPAFAAAHSRIMRCHAGDDVIVVPSFFVVEVSGALARRGIPKRDIEALLDNLTQSPHQVVTVGPRAARSARTIAIASKLRGPDALYVWLAKREGIALCTLDQELAARGAQFARMIPP